MYLSKRQKIIISAVIITLGLILSTQSLNFFFYHYRIILVLGFLAYILTIWSLWEGMTRLKAIVLMILPTMFTIAVTSFYFLLPVRWLTRLPVAILFGLSFYSLLLSQNVFNIAAIRTIPLYRAATTVSFLFTLITAFFLYNVVFALNLSFYWNGLSVFAISLPLILQVLWTVQMEKVNSTLVIYSMILSLMIGECAVALSFWPVAPTIWSLSLSSMMYVLLGIVTEFMRERLKRRIIWEYVLVGAVVVLFGFWATSWTG